MSEILLMILKGPILSGFSLSEKLTWRKFLFSTKIPMSKAYYLFYRNRQMN